VSLIHVVDGVAVAARWAIALGREGVHEVEEAHVAVLAAAVSAAAGDGVVALVLGGAQVGDLLALVVGQQGFTAASYEGGGVLLVVSGVIGEALGVVVVGVAVDEGSCRTGLAEPDVAVGVRGPEGDFDAVVRLHGRESGVALDELRAHGVSGDYDLVHVGESTLVLVVGHNFVEDVE